MPICYSFLNFRFFFFTISWVLFVRLLYWLNFVFVQLNIIAFVIIMFHFFVLSPFDVVFPLMNVLFILLCMFNFLFFFGRFYQFSWHSQENFFFFLGKLSWPIMFNFLFFLVSLVDSCCFSKPTRCFEVHFDSLSLSDLSSLVNFTSLLFGIGGYC